VIGTASAAKPAEQVLAQVFFASFAYSKSAPHDARGYQNALAFAVAKVQQTRIN